MVPANEAWEEIQRMKQTEELNETGPMLYLIDFYFYFFSNFVIKF